MSTANVACPAEQDSRVLGSANLAIEHSNDSMKMGVVGKDGQCVTVLKLDKADPSYQEALQLIQDVEGNSPTSRMVTAMKLEEGLAKTVGRQRLIIAVMIATCIAAVPFGLTMGTSVLGGSLIKMTHTQSSNVFSANNDYVVESAEAAQNVPLYYLPFMNEHLLASTIGKTIMYTSNGNAVYSIIKNVSKPANQLRHEAHVETMQASLVIKAEEATLEVDGPNAGIAETELCGGIAGSKMSSKIEDDLDAVMQEALGEQGARRLQGSRLHACWPGHRSVEL